MNVMNGTDGTDGMNRIEDLMKDGEKDQGKYGKKIGEPSIVRPTPQRHWWLLWGIVLINVLRGYVRHYF
jgi:hypothetical protein